MTIARRSETQIRKALPHLPAHQVASLASAVNRLVERFDPVRIYVLGSQARGTPRSDSDMVLREGRLLYAA